MTVESEIRSLENERAEAQLNHDLSSFFGLFSSEFVANNPYNKVVNREKVFEIFKKGWQEMFLLLNWKLKKYLL